MSKIERFEDMAVWSSSMTLCIDIYGLTNEGLFTKDFSLKDQIRRSAISIPSNISEGFERNSNNQFIYFLVIAKGSCGELRTQLRIAFNLNYIVNEEYEKLNAQCLSISKQSGGFITYLREIKKSLIKE